MHCPSIPDGHYMVYDAENYEDKGASCIEAVKEIIPERAPIYLLVLSHTDGDHVGALPVMVGYTVLSSVCQATAFTAVDPTSSPRLLTGSGINTIDPAWWRPVPARFRR